MTEQAPHRLYLREDQIPTQWYNLRADMPEKPEPIRLPNGQVAAPEDLAPVFCDELVRQELDDDTAYVDIPEPVLEMYRIYRPSPLCRAYNLEKALGTPAKIYYKFEGNRISTASPPRRVRASGARRSPRRRRISGSIWTCSW